MNSPLKGAVRSELRDSLSEFINDYPGI